MIGGWHPTQAVGPDGERADVKDVANGLQCRCRCYDCGQPVLAKQGPKVRWHYAHHAPTNCRPTPESELHFFAKTLLAEKLWLWIPAVKAEAAGRTEPISDRQQYKFSQVKVEKADGNSDTMDQSMRLAAERMVFKMHRTALAWGTMGEFGLCGKYIMPIMRKQQYRLQMVNPVAATTGRYACQPPGGSTAVQLTSHTYPVVGEDVGYLLWRKRNCCAF